MWAGENRRNALRMESVCAIDPDSILTSVVESNFRKNRRKIRKREREKDTQQGGRQRQKRRWTSIEGSITSIHSRRVHLPGASHIIALCMSGAGKSSLLEVFLVSRTTSVGC